MNGLGKIVLLLLIATTACSTQYERPGTLPKKFPRVSGAALTGESVTLPDQFSGSPVVILIGYVQRAQFDIDRWILGLMQTGVQTNIIEVPTITGMAPSIVSEFINDGMRSGIPEEDWRTVITLYDDAAEKVKTAFGTERPQSASVVLLDAAGKITWFSNRGYSATQVLELTDRIRSLE